MQAGRKNILRSCHRKFDARPHLYKKGHDYRTEPGGNREQLCPRRCRNQNSVFLSGRGGFDLCIAACVDHSSSITTLHPTAARPASVAKPRPRRRGSSPRQSDLADWTIIALNADRGNLLNHAIETPFPTGKWSGSYLSICIDFVPAGFDGSPFRLVFTEVSWRWICHDTLQ